MRRQWMVLLGWMIGGAANAATFTVNSLADGVDTTPGNGVCATAAGTCSLRAAVQESNALMNPDTITLPPGTYTLTLAGSLENMAVSGDLDIMDDVTIIGADPSTTIINGGGRNGLFQDRIFHILGAHDAAGVMRPMTVTLRGITISGGSDPMGGNGGGGICNHCEDTNVASGANLPTLHLIDTVVSANYSCIGGGGISNFGTLIIDDSRIQDNFTPYGFAGFGVPVGFGGGMGGGIMNWGGTVSIVRSVISNNLAQTGGGIYNQDTFVPGVVLLEDTTVSNNKSAMGAGVYNVASGDYNFPARILGVPGITINRSTIADNTAELHGGGIYNLGIGTLVMLNSTVSNNLAGTSFFIASSQGGGIYNGGRLLDISSSTISGNEATAARVSDVTTSASRGGDEIFFNTTNAGGAPGTTIPMRIIIKNSIIGDGALTDDNCNGAVSYAAIVTSGGNNIDSGNTCGFIAGSDRSSVEPLVDVLANNGGLTQTRALFSGSPAISAGNACPAIDQRGFARDVLCDVGALESGAGGSAPPAPVNTPPIARNGAINVAPGATVGGTLVAVDANRDPLTYQLVTNGTQGTVTIMDSVTGAFTYTALANATGTDTFTFKANDGRADSNTAIITVTITTAAPNAPPIAQGLSVAVAPGAQVNNILIASDQNNNPLQFSIVANPVKGTVTITNPVTGAFTYTANATATGADTFTFKVNDGLADSNVATVSVAIVSANTPPVATPGILTVAPGATVTVALQGSDANTNDVLTYSIVAQSTKGVATITNAATGSVVYTAAATAAGTDIFSFKVNDGKVDSAAAAITVTFAVTNTAPIANNGTLNVAPGASATGVLVARDGNPADVLTYSIVANGINGTATITNAATGAFSYAANANITGTDTFTFKANDGAVDSNIATITVNISTANTPPVAVPGILTAIAGKVTSGTLAANNPITTVSSYSLLSPASQGTVTLIDATSGAFTYQPNPGSTGTDSFTYLVKQGSVQSVASVTISIVPPNSVSPLLAGDLKLVVNGSKISGKLAAKGVTGKLSFSIKDQATQGTVVLNPATGTFTYTADAGATGVDRFTFKVNNGIASSNLGTVTLTLKGATTAPSNSTDVPTNTVADQGGGGAMELISLLLLLIGVWRRKLVTI